jgi:hypothetical protein
MLEGILRTTYRFIVDEKRDGKFPAWRRHDVKNWNRRELMLGAVTIMPVRVFLIIFSVISLCIFTTFITFICGQQDSLNGWKGTILRGAFTVHATVICFLMGFKITVLD